MKRKTLLSIAPPKIGGVDFLLPMFLAIKKQKDDISIELLIVNKMLGDELYANKFLMDELELLSVNITSIGWEPKKISFQNVIGNRKVMINLFNSIVRLLLFIFKLILDKNVIMIHAGTVRRGLMRVLACVVHYRGGEVYAHNKVMTITFGRDDVGIREREGCEDGVLLFENSSCVGGAYHVIGYPKLYDAWTDLIKDRGLDFRKNSLNADSGAMVVSLFLSSIVDNVFNADDYEEWLCEVLFVIEDIFPEAIVLIKPHPPVSRYRGIIESIINGSSIKYIVVTDVHSGVVASASDLVVSSHSSVIIDAMSVNVPVVFHQFFTEHWKVRHPEKSSFLHLGLLHSQDKHSLKIAIWAVLENSYLVPDVRSILNHKENLSPFLDSKYEGMLK